MCGLVGIVSGTPSVLEGTLESALKSIQHRGPDDTGVWVNPDRTCGLGHARLSIIDLSGGHQPLSSPDGSIQAIVNGEFYDYEEIREEFVREGYQFRSSSDSEILIPLYLKYGERCVEHLRGEFGFVLWDSRSRELFMARDRFGIKPLFYSRYGDAFYVGSEIKALLGMGVPARWDAPVVRSDELGYRNSTDTLFRDIKNVPPGYSLTISNGRVRERRYWDFNYPERRNMERSRGKRAYIEEFLELLTGAVKTRMRADVPVGVYLSGGIDSSTVLSLMSQSAGSDLDAFTLSFETGHYDEGPIAREMAERLGVRHHIIDVEPEDLAPNFEETVWHNECTFGNSNTIAKYLLSRHVRDAGLKVVLTGEGADEILGGYEYFMTDMRVHNSRRLGPSIGRAIRLSKRLIGKTDPFTQAPPGLSAVKAKFGFIPAALLFTGTTESNYAGIRSPEFEQSTQTGELFEPLMAALDQEQLSGRDPLNQALYLASKSSLANSILTTLGDRVEMAHSIEARLPFLDHKVVEFLTRVPVDFKNRATFRGGVEKYLLKEAARDLVTDTLYKRTKHPFQAPPTTSSRSDPLAEFLLDTLSGDGMKQLPFYDQPRILKLFERSKDRPYVSRLLMRVAVLVVMQKRFGLSL